MQLHDIGIAGLAVMGENLVLNMASKGFSVAVHNRTHAKTKAFLAGRGKGKKISGFEEVRDFVRALERPRRIMLMLRAGAPVDAFIEQLLPLLDPGDIVIDGGNSNYRDTERRLNLLEARDLLYVGTGVSGGEEGALKGPSIMPGGSAAAWPRIGPLLTAIAARAEDGSPCCAWIGPGGAGHFVKMVHNGIEYGDMQLICEAFHFMQTALGMTTPETQPVFAAWNRGDLRSYLIEITADITAFAEKDGHPLVDSILDVAGQKGTGKWTVDAALDYGVPLSLISEAVFARSLSGQLALRTKAAAVFNHVSAAGSFDREAVLADLEQALFAAKIISYTQGFGLLQAASDDLAWNLDLAEIARIWRSGCIIRSVFLDRIADAYGTGSRPETLLLAPFFRDKILHAQQGLRRIVGIAVAAGVPLPGHASAVSYFDALRTARLPLNLLQAQRDYFGAHMYERVDTPRGKWFHTNWTGEGGATTSTAYSR